MQKPPAGTLIKPGHPQAQESVGWWMFNTGFGSTLYDYSPHTNWENRNHGMLNGPTWVPGRDGPALSFNGTTDYVAIDNTDEDFNFGTNSFSVGIQINSNPTADVQILMQTQAAASRFRIRLRSNGRLEVRIGDGVNVAISADDGYALDDGLNHFIFVVINRSDNTMTRYVDGLLYGAVRDISSVGNINNTGDLFIGNTVNTFDGLISRAIVFPARAFFAAEIAWRYKNPHAMFQRAISPAMFFVPGIMNQFQGPNLGADLYDGSFM